MEINNIDSLISYIKENPANILCSYDGDWIVYEKVKDDLKLLDDVKFNNEMMRSLEDLQLFNFEDYMISHHSVRLYRINDIDYFQLRINNIKLLLENLLTVCKNESFTSIKHIKSFLNTYDYYISTSKEFYFVSHFGGGKDIQTLNVFKKVNDRNVFGFSFPYYMVSNLKDNGFYERLNRLYTSIYNMERI